MTRHRMASKIEIKEIKPRPKAPDNDNAPPPSPPLPPPPPQKNYTDLESARQEIQRITSAFFRLDERKNFFELVAESVGLEIPPPVWAMRIATGTGKTRIVVAEIAKSGKHVIYAVPTHKLGSGIEDLFASHGMTARVFRGRMASDPERPGEMMCLNVDAVDLALKAYANISETCCKSKGQQCQFFEECGYQRQRTMNPDIWIVATDMIFHRQETFGKPAALIIDESFWRKSLRGAEHNERLTVPLASLATSIINPGRRDLAAELSLQPDNGGLQRRYVEGMTSAALTNIINVEWAHMPQIGLHPGISRSDLKRLHKDRETKKTLIKIAQARRVIKILEELRNMLDHPEIKVSGRLLLEEEDGQRVIRWRGVAPISKQFCVPTLLLDATLPDLPVLQVLHPQAEIIADINIGTPPSVRIRQILDSPTSSRKLIDPSGSKKPERHLNAVRRYILQRWLETGKQSALVICQQKVAEWLYEKLPEAIAVMHYNAIAGLDTFKDVRLLILAGRLQPGPDAVEALAATLSGSMPASASRSRKGFAWYQQVRRSIQLRDGSSIAVIGDQHPDAFAESVREMICEAELLQALGRARAINRTEQTPLDIDMLLNTVLPITVDEVVGWEAPNLLFETAVEGGVLTSPVDLVQVWPSLWPNTRAADRTLTEGIPSLPGFVPVSYQPQGPKMNKRIGYFDPELIPDPRVWLEARLGPLKEET